MAITDKPIITFHPETFDDLEEERAHRNAKLAGALRVFGRLGFGEGVAGHMTARDHLDGSLLGEPVRKELPSHEGKRPSSGQS